MEERSKITGRREETGRGRTAIAALLGHLGSRGPSWSDENLGGGGAANVRRGSFDCQPDMIESCSTNELFIPRLIVIINNTTV